MKCEMITLRKIWIGEEKFYYEVGPDLDGLGCIEIRYSDGDGKTHDRMTFPPEAARLISTAIGKCADELEENKG